MTASTFLAVHHSFRDSISSFPGSYWYSSSEIHYDLASLRFSGWDHRYPDIAEAIADHNLTAGPTNIADVVATLPSYITEDDYAHTVEGAPVTRVDGGHGENYILNSILSFKKKHNLDRVFVINLSCPMSASQNDGSSSSSTIEYRNAALRANSDWVEFTPSPSIDEEFLERAQESQIRVMGRDGSTGQTVLKLVLRDYLRVRGFEICDWYSTNLIGNHDGLVLQDVRYNATKMDDKKSVLDDSLPRSRHVVDIAYHESSGDNKESWDCVHFRGWGDALMSLRMNWHGSDSFLAGGLLFDIIMSLIHANETDMPYGVVDDCAIFFKAPYGVRSDFASQLARFRSFVNRR